MLGHETKAGKSEIGREGRPGTGRRRLRASLVRNVPFGGRGGHQDPLTTCHVRHRLRTLGSLLNLIFQLLFPKKRVLIPKMTLKYVHGR